MDELAGGATGAGDQGERLESWKAIAAYLKRGVTTVQRWEQHEGLPVHRLPHDKKGSVFALTSELDAWRQARTQFSSARPHASEEAPAIDAEKIGPSRVVGFVRRQPFVLVLLVAVAIGLWAVAMMRGRGGSYADALVRGEKPIVARPLANDAADETCPSLSPDGNHVVYHWDRDEDAGLYIKPVNGGEPRQLATGDAGRLAECAYARWSPKGDLIAFLTRGDPGTRDIWVIAPSGGRPRRITSMSGIGLCWASDAQSLAFVDRNSAAEPFSIFSISVSGGQRRRLTTPPLGAFGDTHCAFSPDGKQLAIVRHANISQSDVFVVGSQDSTQSEPEHLTTGSTGIAGVEWSPDGSLIVFGSNHGLWKIPVKGEGHEATRIAAFEGGAYDPTFSRSTARGAAQRLAYTATNRNVNNWRWDVANRRGENVAASTWWEDYPAVAPNGDRVAFASNRTGANEVWTVNTDGSGLQQLTFHRGPVVTAPQWSPDGKHIAFSSQVGANRDIYVMQSDGSQSNRLTMAPSEERNPSWSRDGRFIYFRSDQGGVGQIWKMPSLGGPATRVTSGEASQAFESPDGRLLYFVRSVDVRGLWSVPVGGGKETLVNPDVREGFWAIADKGIYFLTLTTAGPPRATALRFFDFTSRTVTAIAEAPAARHVVFPGFAASPDGKFVIWTQVDTDIRDLMIIDPWRP